MVEMEYKKELTLIKACEMQNYNLAGHLLRRGVDVNVMSESGVTPIEATIRSMSFNKDQDTFIQKMVDKKAIFDINVKLKNKEDDPLVHISMIPLLSRVKPPILDTFIEKIKDENPSAFINIFDIEVVDEYIQSFNFKTEAHKDYLKTLVLNGANVHAMLYLEDGKGKSNLDFGEKRLLKASLDAFKDIENDSSAIQDSKAKNLMLFLLKAKDFKDIDNLDTKKLEFSIKKIVDLFNDKKSNLDGDMFDLLSSDFSILDDAFSYLMIRDMLESEIKEDVLWDFYNLTMETAFSFNSDLIINMCDNVEAIINNDLDAKITSDQLRGVVNSLSKALELYESKDESLERFDNYRALFEQELIKREIPKENVPTEKRIKL